jgi:hypothetical protein
LIGFCPGDPKQFHFSGSTYVDDVAEKETSDQVELLIDEKSFPEEDGSLHHPSSPLFLLFIRYTFTVLEGAELAKS